MDAAVVARAVSDAAAVLDASAMDALRAGGAFIERPHGTRIAFVRHGPHRRRVIEIDPHGTLLAALRWRDDALIEATLRIPDGRFVTIEPGRTSDRLWLGRRPGLDGAAPLLEYAAVDYASIREVPVLSDPSRLPTGAGTAVLNMIAALALDAAIVRLAYRGPYPTEQLFLSLLESFRYVGGTRHHPLAAFANGQLEWEPAPHERRHEREGAVVYLRQRIEKVVWEGRAYYRPDWQAVARHAPRRVRDVGDRVVCSMWVLGAPVEDHLTFAADGGLLAVVAPAPPVEPSRALPPDVLVAVVATVAATAIPALAPFVREAGRALSAEWGAVTRDLVTVDGTRIRISTRVRAAACTRLRETADQADRVALGFALVGELAGLIGDMLRGRAQALIAALPPPEQTRALEATEDPDGDASSAAIGRGIEPLLRDLDA